MFLRGIFNFFCAPVWDISLRAASLPPPSRFNPALRYISRGAAPSKVTGGAQGLQKVSIAKKNKIKIKKTGGHQPNSILILTFKGTFKSHLSVGGIPMPSTSLGQGAPGRPQPPQGLPVSSPGAPRRPRARSPPHAAKRPPDEALIFFFPRGKSLSLPAQLLFARGWRGGKQERCRSSPRSWGLSGAEPPAPHPAPSSSQRTGWVCEAEPLLFPLPGSI